MSEAERLEGLWAGRFGSEYTQRCGITDHRGGFWKPFVERWNPARVLEVGCGAGSNLYALTDRLMQPEDVYGIDINREALYKADRFNVSYGKAKDIPFKDRFFDLVFTCGVLIHQPAESLLYVMSEIVRCSCRYVLAMEYHAPKREEVPYREQQGALFKDDYGNIYQREFGLKLLDMGHLGKEEGFDNVVWWMMEKP